MLPSRPISDKLYGAYEVASCISHDELIVETVDAGQLKSKNYRLEQCAPGKIRRHMKYQANCRAGLLSLSAEAIFQKKL